MTIRRAHDRLLACNGSVRRTAKVGSDGCTLIISWTKNAAPVLWSTWGALPACRLKHGHPAEPLMATAGATR